MLSQLDQRPLPSTNPPTLWRTILSRPAWTGDTLIQVDSTRGLRIGQAILIGEANPMVNRIVGFGSVILATPLDRDFAQEPLVCAIPLEDDFIPVDLPASLSSTDARPKGMFPPPPRRTPSSSSSAQAAPQPFGVGAGLQAFPEAN